MVDLAQDTTNATLETLDEDFMKNEEAIFVRMLTEFNQGISEVSTFHDKLTRQLQDLDNTNIERLINSEKAAAKLVEDLDKCDDIMRFLSDRLQAYDDVLNQVEESMEKIKEKTKLETSTDRENVGQLFADLEDYTRLVTQVGPEHLELLQHPKFCNQVSVDQTSEAVRRSCSFLVTKTPTSQLQAYKERTQFVQDALDRFVDEFYSHFTTLVNKMRDSIPLGNAQLIPKRLTVYRQFQMFSEIIQLVEENKPAVYQRLFDTYQRKAQAIFTQDIQVLFESMIQKVQNKPMNSIQDLEDTCHLLEVALNESSTMIEAEQKFVSKCFHIPLADDQADSPQLSKKMCDVLKPMFERLFQGFKEFLRTCANKAHLVVGTLFVRLVSVQKKYNDSASYFSIVFGDVVVATRKLVEEEMVNRMAAYKVFKASKKKRIGILPMINDFNELILVYEEVFKECKDRSVLEKWITKLSHTIIHAIEVAATRSKPKYPPKLVRFENYQRLYNVLSTFHGFDALKTIRQLVKKKCIVNFNPDK